ncbi:glucose 1-dehydrogenase [Maribacter sp. Asnod2-G09]|uniref:glucose 1-dehydrogenase n=1 Tax=Maribacter sp. Asnod2-G09 TaxID=3160577 RepID=UPI00386C6D68
MSIKQRFDLTGKVAVITGSSKGIGLSIAKGLAENGAKVVISSRKQDAVDAVAKEMQEAGFEAIGIACHIGEADQREALIAKTIEKYGRIDILVNNAAINPYYGPLEASNEEAFDKIMNVNVKAPCILSNLAHPHMKAQGSGSIINISSVEGIHPGFNLGLYSVSKAAMIMLSKNQAKEWGRHGIRSNAVCPGLVKTKLSEALWSDDKLAAGYKAVVPLRRIAIPDELAGVVMLLASDAGSYMTGGEYTVDGGYLISG